MDIMIEHLKELSKAIPLETAYDWKMPANIPIDIPPDVVGPFSRNIYLKENLAPLLEHDRELAIHYWIIRDWGGIRTFRVGDHNNERIRTFKEEVRKGKLTRDTFASISSLSKLSSFWDPERYAIYDSRAIFSLNWLIFRHCKDKMLFPQPIGRNATISNCDTHTIFGLSRTDHRYRSNKTAYHDYCALLQDLSGEIYGKRKPYFVEMLLFLAAPANIFDDIKSSVTITISGK